MARRAIKPTQAQYRVRRGSPFAGKTLQRLIVPTGLSMESSLRDLVTGELLTFARGTSATEGFSPTAEGKGLRFGSSTGNVNASFPVRNEARNSFTMFWHGVYHTNTAILIRDNTGGGGTLPVWRGTTGFDARVGGTDYTEAGTWTTDAPTSVLLSSGAAAVQVYGNGDLVINGGAPGATALASPWWIHKNGTNANGCNATLLCLAIWDYPFSQAQCERFLDDPYGWLLEPAFGPMLRMSPIDARIPFWAAPASSGTTGTLAVTEAADTLAASGALSVSGTLAVTEASDTLAAAGTLAASGALAVTEDDDTLAAVGTLPITGTLAVTEANDTAAATGEAESAAREHGGAWPLETLDPVPEPVVARREPPASVSPPDPRADNESAPAAEPAAGSTLLPALADIIARQPSPEQRARFTAEAALDAAAAVRSAHEERRAARRRNDEAALLLLLTP